MKMYMHTIDGRPAGFSEEQICFAQKGKKCWKAPLVKDLRTIKKQQKKSKEYREKAFEEYVDDFEYDYIVVDVPLRVRGEKR